MPTYEELIKLGAKPLETQNQIETNKEPQEIKFLERLKYGFGGGEAKQKQQDIERSLGLKGKLDIGDVADVGGATLPIIGGVLGAAALPGLPNIGAGIGAGGGQALRRGVGAYIGADQPTVGEVAKDAAYTGIGTAIGGKILGGAFNFISKYIPTKLISTIFKQSADDIAASVKSGGKNLTQSEEILNEGFIGNAGQMMKNSWKTMQNLEKQAQVIVKNKPVQISNKNGYVSMIDDYVKNLKDVSYGFEPEIIKTGKSIVKELKKSNSQFIPGDIALATRRFIDSVRRTASFKSNPNLSPKEATFKKAADNLRKSLSRDIPGLEDIMKRYSIHINAFEDLANHAARSENKALFDLIDVFIIYGIDPTAYLARRGLTSAGVSTTVAQTLHKGGNIVNKILPKGASAALGTRSIGSIFNRQE